MSLSLPFNLLLAFATSFVVSLLITPLIRKLAIKHHFVDDPNRHHPAILHQQPIPRAGGVAMFIAFVFISIFFAKLNLIWLGIILGGGINVIVGTLDDKYDLSPVFRLIMQTISAAILVVVGVSFYTTNPFSSSTLTFDYSSFSIFNSLTITLPADIILIFWVVWIMNTTNWTKGVSQLPGVATIAFLTIAAVALKYQAGNPYQIQTALLAVISAGAVLAFLPFNFPPEKMFPGFGASTWIGFNLAALSILSGGKVATLLIVFSLPIIDAILVGIRRIMSGHSPLKNDRQHIYHFLLDAGMSKRQIIYLYWITAILFGASAVLLNKTGKIISIASLTLLITILFIYLYGRKRPAPPTP